MADIIHKKEFTQRQLQILIIALELSRKGYERRIAAEQDHDALNVWQTKADEIAAVAQKLRLT